MAGDSVAGFEREPGDRVAHVAVDAVDADLRDVARGAGEALRQLLDLLLREEEAHAGFRFGPGRELDERVALEAERVLQRKAGAANHDVERDVGRARVRAPERGLADHR